MKLCLDLFCGVGGASAGYKKAGFDVTGVDIVEQPNYPYDQYIRDVLTLSPSFLAQYDFIHASPPCQAFSIMNRTRKFYYPDLIPDTRRLLELSGRPYVIENVPLAPLIRPVMLCGKMFGLRVLRHRAFECSFNVPQLADPPHHDYYAFGSTTILGSDSERLFKLAMGITWGTNKESRQAIPPAYTEYIGKYALEVA